MRALEQVIIEGELSVDQTLYPMAHVDIVAGNEIIIQNESIIQGDITLKLDEFWTSTTTPIVSNEDVTAFCAGLAPIQYQANSPSRSLVGEIAMSSMSGQLKTIFRIFPNPAQDLLNIKTTGVSDLQSVDVLSTIGTLILSVPASKFTLPNNVCINANTLESGTYYLRCTYANGETQLKSFVVVH